VKKATRKLIYDVQVEIKSILQKKSISKDTSSGHEETKGFIKKAIS
jgi:hypothetical protein